MYFKLTLYTQRYRMIAYAVLTTVFVVLATLPVTMLWKDGAWHFVRATDPRAIALFWEQGTANVIAALTIVLAFCAGDLGVTAMGDDSEQLTLEWVATRPRSRRKLAFAAWAASATNTLLLSAVAVAAYAAILVLSTHELDVPNSLHTLIALAAPAFAMLSLAYFLAVGTGSARNGYLLALFTLVFFAVLRFGYFNIVLKRYVPLWLFTSNNLYQPQMTYAMAAWVFAASVLLSFGGAAIFARRDL
jgi:ABC-type transport system involved in multi-copper enzyme maturation permease subunit